MSDRKLRVFLCHSSQDKPIVRELYQGLNAKSWIDPGWTKNIREEADSFGVSSLTFSCNGNFLIAGGE